MESRQINHFLEENQLGQRKNFKKGEIIFHEDTPSCGLYYIIKGIIKIYITDESGREIILRLAGPGDIIGHQFIFRNKNHTESSKAVEHSSCIFIEKNSLFEYQKKNHEAIEYLILKVGEEIRNYQLKNIELINKNVRERLACHFINMSNHHGDRINDKIKIKVQLSREEIASIIGTASETAIRFISEFKELGLIEEIDRFFYILKEGEILELSGRN